MEYYSLTEVGASGLNADRSYISPDKKVFAMSDGASGAFDKVAAGDICIQAVKELSYGVVDLTPYEYISTCIHKANARLIARSQEDGNLTFGTMTVVVHDDGVLSVGAVGDSPAFLIKGNRLIKLVQPKKKFSRLIELGILTKEEVNNAIASLPSEMWSVFDNFLPMVIPQIAYEEYSVTKGDILIICTDGVSDWVKEEEFVSILRGGGSIEESCEKLFEVVNERCPAGKRDDKTMVVGRL